MPAPILSCEAVGLVQGMGWLFRGLDVHVGARDRLALIGRNGAGKTTLLKLIAGMVEPDEGRVTVQPGTRIVLLEQEPALGGHATLVDWTGAGADAPAAHKVAAIADRLGVDLARPCETASGGERRRAAIARALAQEPQLLLLDEPTNHLDLAAIEWLEGWLQRFSGAFVVISHDRAFLSRLTTNTLWLDRGGLKRAEIGFGGFEAWTEQVLAEEARNAERLDARLKIEEHWLERGVTARRRRNQGRLAKLQDMRAERAAMTGAQGIAKLATATDEVRSKTVIEARNVAKRFGDRAVIRDFTLRIQRGDRIGIVGANGTGKTTLIRLLTGELAPDEGEIRLAATLNGTVIDQQRRLMAPDRTVREVLAEGGDWIDVLGTRKHVAGYLKEFLFDPAVAETKVGALSGGERSRLLLAREFARPSNLLVLDEPTNDLDMETLDLLQEVIADYAGTVLLVSHDRDFLDRTVTMVLGLDGSGRVDIVAGGYEDWARRRRAVPEAKRPSAPKVDAPTTCPARAKLTYKDQRDLDRLPVEIERLETEIARDEAVLSDAGLYARDRARFDALMAAVAKARDAKDAAETRWLELAEMAESLG